MVFPKNTVYGSRKIWVTFCGSNSLVFLVVLYVSESHYYRMVHHHTMLLFKHFVLQAWHCVVCSFSASPLPPLCVAAFSCPWFMSLGLWFYFLVFCILLLLWLLSHWTYGFSVTGARVHVGAGVRGSWLFYHLRVGFAVSAPRLLGTQPPLAM